MNATGEYEFRPPFRGPDYEWDPRPLEPADLWTPLAKQALLRHWNIEVAEAGTGTVWAFGWNEINSAGTRGAGLAVTPAGREAEAPTAGPAPSALILEHCRQPGGTRVLPAAVWHALRAPDETTRLILDATGQTAPYFHLRGLPEPERAYLAALGPSVSIDGPALPVDRATALFVRWALAPAEPLAWLHRIVPSEPSQALTAFLSKDGSVGQLLDSLEGQNESLSTGWEKVEANVERLQRLAGLVGGCVQLKARPIPRSDEPDLDLAGAEILLPVGHHRSLALARRLGLDLPAPPRPEAHPGPELPPVQGAAPASLSAPSEPDHSAAPEPVPAAKPRAADGPNLTPRIVVRALGLVAIAAAFVAGRSTAPGGAPSVAGKPPTADASAVRVSAAVSQRPVAAERRSVPSLRVVLAEEQAEPSPAVLAAPTCTANGDVLWIEPEHVTILPCGRGEPRDAICVGGACRLAARAGDDLPETACGRDGAALELDREDGVYRPAPGAAACAPAWYGVPSARDPSLLFQEAAALRPRPHHGQAERSPVGDAARGWAQLIRSEPAETFTIVGYASGASLGREECGRAEARGRAAVTQMIDALAAERPAIAPQVLRPAVRACAPWPPKAGAESAAIGALRIFLVRGFVPGCACADLARKAAAGRAEDKR